MHLPSSYLRAGALALTIACLSVPAANAVVVTVDSQQYDVTTITGSYEEHAATLQAQVWWGNEDIARSFVSEVEDQLGFPNFDFPDLWLSPVFAFKLFEMEETFGSILGLVTCSTGRISDYPVFLTSSVTFAVAAPVQPAGVPDPGVTIALLGLGLGGLITLRRRLV